jgi:hypothetical protein
MRHGIALNKIHIQHAWEASERFGAQICTVSLLVGELFGGEFVGWPEPDSVLQEQKSGGIRNNPEESGVNTGIPVLQKFLQKVPVTVAKIRNSCNPLQTHIPVKNPLENTGEKRNPQESCFFCFLASKIDSCQIGIGNLVPLPSQ